MKHLTLGVMGHVDHGKTSLVRALTGIDTDRLPEEKARGMSIVPGFAWLEGRGGTVDIIDVPGHEDFLRGMIAGAAGIDAAMLVVDANEGPRAQTFEHLAVAALLGVRCGIVALNKVDLVDSQRCRGAEDALREALAGGPLGDAPFVRVSAATGEGLADLHAALDSLLDASAANEAAGCAFHLGVDRAFVLPGQGTVVTGTLRGGAVERGAEVEILPSGLVSQVRQVQVHGRSAERALPGQRVGLNLRGVRADQVGRGCVVAARGTRHASDRLDVELELLPGCSVKPGETLRAFAGTDSAAARIRGGVTLEGPVTSRIRLRCQRAICVAPGERFILRSDARHLTLGGGRVVSLVTSELALDAALLEDIETRLLAALEAFHAKEPAREGAPLTWWRSMLAEAQRGQAFEAALARLISARRVEVARDCVRRAGFDPMRDLPPFQRRCADEIEHCFREAGSTPPDVTEVVAGDAMREAVCRLLVARGRLVRVGSHAGVPIVFHRDALDEARERIARAFPAPVQFSVSQARELVGSTRKYVVPLLEFLDASHFTRRRGDLRTIARAAGNHAPAAQSDARR